MTETPHFKVVTLTHKERKLLKRSSFERSVQLTPTVSLNKSEFYAFRDWEDGDVLFDIRAIKNAILNGDIQYIVLEMDLDKELVARALARGGVDRNYIDAENHGSDIDEPTLTVLWSDGQGVLINGNHRIVRRYNKDLKKIRCIVLPHMDGNHGWKHFAQFNEDIPEEARELFEGLPTKEEYELARALR